MSTAEVCEALGLSQLKGRRWHVQGAVAIRGEGLYEGLDWCDSTLLSGHAYIIHGILASFSQNIVVWLEQKYSVSV